MSRLSLRICKLRITNTTTTQQLMYTTGSVGEISRPYTATRFSAVKATIDSQVFCEAADRGHVVAQYIYKAFGEQERKFYEDAIKPPEKRFMPRWFTNRHPRWRKAHGDALPETFEDIQPFSQMTLYDVVAGLICPLLEYDFFKNIYQPYRGGIWMGDKEVDHYVIIGRPADGTGKTNPDINPSCFQVSLYSCWQEGFVDRGTVQGYQYVG
ncbi:hypothetical protein ACMFMF_011885 [Clarireedia jacksonii]